MKLPDKLPIIAINLLLAVNILFNRVPCKAQINLIRNPGLEQYTHCPDDMDEMKYANYWMSLDSTWSPPDWAHDNSGIPEYLNICGTGRGGTIPNNGFYYNFPRTGNGMAEVEMFNDEYDPDFPYYRDYMQGHLVTTLTPGQSYCVTFYVALEQSSSYAINHMGAYFDDGSIDTTHNFEGIHNECTPQVIDTAIILDTAGWLDTFTIWTWKGKWAKVQGSFIANGTERLMTIANFSDKMHTNAIAIQDTIGGFADSIGGYALYLVDDISVVASDASPDAGPDIVMPSGSTDSVTIGDTLDTYLPVYWYANGVLIDSNKASIRVLPDSTTTYIVQLNLCSGEPRYDTVIVWVGSLISNVLNSNYTAIQVFPDPAANELNISNAKNYTVLMYDIVGNIAYNGFIASDKEIVDISKLPAGVYILQLINRPDGNKITRKIVKE